MSVKSKPTSVRFTTKGQVVIPSWLRKEFHIENGTEAIVEATPSGILLKPITRSYIKSLRGSLKGKGVLKALTEDRKREQEL